jgi:hypothetical protein
MSVPTYRILTNPKYPQFDPFLPWWRKLLGVLRIISRRRFVVQHPHHNTLVCHPKTVPIVKELLDRNHAKYTVSPLLSTVKDTK